MPLRKNAKKTTQSVLGIPSNFTEAFQYLEEASGPSDVRRENLLAAIKIVSETASTIGLNAELLIRLVDVIGSAKFADAVNRKLISCLIPNIRIPGNAIISALSWIFSRTLLVNSQKFLMEWIVAAFYYDVIDRTNRFHSLYDTVFCLLLYEDLCPYVCHVLFLLTRKENVTPYHVRKLINLHMKVGSQPYILGLLNLYHQFRPDLVAIQPRPLKYFRSLKRWRLVVEVPYQANNASDRIQTNLASLQIVAPRTGRNKVLQYQDLESVLDGTDNFLTVLKSPHRRILITSCEDILMKFKLHFMLEIEDEWFGPSSNVACSSLLKSLADVYTESQESLETAELVISRYLDTWDGSRFCEDLFRIITHLDMCTFDQLKTLLLDTLHNLFVTSGVPFQLETIRCLSLLFQNWVLMKYDPAESVIYPTNSSINEDSWSIFQLASYIDNLCVLGSMQHLESEDRFHFAGLYFYSIVLHLIDLGYLDLLIVPSASIVFGSLFTFSAALLSQVCLLMSRYRNAVAKLRNTPIRSRHGSKALELGVKTLNTYITDMCNTLWRCKGLIPSPASCIYDEKLPASIVNTIREPNHVFATYRHPALMVSTMAFLMKSKDVPIESRHIMTNSAVRGTFMQHLSSCNYSGIIAFIQTFIKLKSQV